MTLFHTLRDMALRRQTWRYYHFDYPYGLPPYRSFPLKQAMIADPARVIYLPIAKNACTSLKTLMADLGGLADARKAKGIHRLLDGEKTDLLFLHRRQAEIDARLADPDWMRFVVLRHPIERLVSVYVEKFVLHRLVPAAGITIDPVILRSTGKWGLGQADYERGISFRQFAEDVLREDPKRLDPHWRHQSLVLDHIPFTHVYTTDHMGVLKADLEAHTGGAIDLPHKNRARDGSEVAATGPCLADALPGDLDTPQKVPPAQFLDADLKTRLEAHYAQDILLYQMAAQHLDQSGTGRLARLIA